MTAFRRRYVAAIGLVSVLASACTGAARPVSPGHASAATSRATRTSVQPSLAQPPTSSSPSAPPRLVPVTRRCGSPNLRDAHSRFVAGPGRARLSIVEVGRGPTTAVFLHQLDGDGLCGWWPFAAWLVQHYPVRAVLADFCGYGASYCPAQNFAADQIVQVRTVVRSTARPGRLVLVGASMGGAVALASTPRTGADAVVDLSGPPSWSGASAAAVAPSVTVPVLIADSPGDPAANYGQLRRAFARIPGAPKKFVTGNGSHGWNLLSLTGTAPFTPLARTVADWIAGRYAG